jgi:hypothetical protein
MFARLLILLLVALPVAAQPGSEKQPLPGRAPLGQWASNGLWALSVSEVKKVGSLAEFKQLPWSKRLTESESKKLFHYAERQVYGKEKVTWLLKTHYKNLSEAKQKAGHALPVWVLRCDDGQEARSSLAYMQKVAWFLEGGMPRQDLLNRNARVSGWIAFFAPAVCQPKQLYQLIYSSQQKRYGKTQDLVINLPQS